ncbi:MAG: hypothetical protein KDK37_12375 [Leptospiraceae bacterium]|nr:hypothetical protein [Leptospiraceae bacterium]MCB1305073.1 hypothetical protein [Leptospiraceae bacterium]
MQDRPDATDLLEAVADFLKKEVLAAVKDDSMLAYKTLVSWNMLGVVGRELRLGQKNLSADGQELSALLKKPELVGTGDYLSDVEHSREMRTELAGQIRNRSFNGSGPGSPVWVYARESLKRRLEIANPRFSLEE